MKSGYLVCVREKAERNLANARVIELLALTLGVRKSSVRIVKGHHTPAKLFAVPSDLF
jgi:uncharacterized protein YggU (UPF0235/DUF167 family)